MLAWKSNSSTVVVVCTFGHGNGDAAAPLRHGSRLAAALALGGHGNGAAPKANFNGLGSGATIVATSMDESSEFDASPIDGR
jgi:hypothetical protein